MTPTQIINMKPPTRKSPGRPVQIPGLIKTPIFLTTQQRDWLARQGGSMATVVRQLIDEAMKRHP